MLATWLKALRTIRISLFFLFLFFLEALPDYISRLLEQLLKAAYHSPQDPQGTRLFFSSTYSSQANLLSACSHRIIFSLKSALLKLVVKEELDVKMSDILAYSLRNS